MRAFNWAAVQPDTETTNAGIDSIDQRLLPTWRHPVRHPVALRESCAGGGRRPRNGQTVPYPSP
jgi:hypothetical protein